MNKETKSMTPKYTVMKFSTFTGKPVYRVLTNGCLETRDGAAKRKFSTREAAQRYADKLGAVS